MIYFDNAATTKPNREVLDTFVEVNEHLYFNPNSPHQNGDQTARLMTQSKAQIKSLLQLNDQTEVIFTSGATESNNMALKGIARHKQAFGKTIITSKLEHPSVLEVMRALADEGFNLEFVNVTKEGRIDLEHLESLLTQDVILVSCMHVNNITGQIQPVAQIASMLKQYPKVHFHVDAVQALGKVPLITEGVDTLSVSGHKFNGLKGQGLLITQNYHQLEPIIHGGGQELNLRSGTVNVPSNVAMVKAIRLALENQAELSHTLSELNQAIRDYVSQFRGIVINSDESASPHILNLSFPGVKGEVLVNAFSKRDVMISTTSACSSKHSSLNEVLLAMGIDEKNIEGSIRLSFGSLNTMAELEPFKKAFEEIYEEVEELLRK
ncbi:cysteine desulfurase family protein [Staphylococcus massiliensis]|uniref:Cysteine desulfurase n=1 Tax=Staphylococcus massiliensis S46 TaxID=1229783 RepID=K9AS10_9STAP|nr:cysteine desulfurase family protein [Staphylococcus massiliensis]EKU50223.1 cysteine desulfurase [Staphylococcus massiliensis S46]PNZ99996.1 cysteine desulfurase [Staphylococcus massiliensis CCUG 55927]